MVSNLSNLVSAGSLEKQETVKQNLQVFSVLALSQVGPNHMRSLKINGLYLFKKIL